MTTTSEQERDMDAQQLTRLPQRYSGTLIYAAFWAAVIGAAHVIIESVR